MSAPDHLRQLDDRELAAAVARLERKVAELAHADTDLGKRIRAGYAEALDAAQAEAERRRT